MRTPLRSTAPESRPPDSWVPGRSAAAALRGPASRTRAPGSAPAPGAARGPGSARRPGSAPDGCHPAAATGNRPARAGRPAARSRRPGGWASAEGRRPLALARRDRGRCSRPGRGRPAAPPCLRSPAVPRPGSGRCHSCVPLAHRQCSFGPSPGSPEHGTQALVQWNEPARRAARNGRGHTAFSRSFAAAAAHFATARCGLRHVARPRFRRTTTGAKTVPFSGH